ncbi:hypothetical protein TNCV_2090571, partial [Trichonephila clavipes]
MSPPQLLQEFPVTVHQNVWFMHDGAPAHFSTEKSQDNADSAEDIDSLKLQLDATKSKLESLEEESLQYEQRDKDFQDEIKMLKKNLEQISMERHRIQASSHSQNEELQQKLDFINSLQEQIENLKLDLEASENESE